MKRSIRSLVSGLAVPFITFAGSFAADAADDAAATVARYQVIVERTWSDATHPADFPLLAHFSPAIGATHDASFALFAQGRVATSGVEKMCEEGKHQPLDAEIKAAMDTRHVGALIETNEPIRSAPGKAATEFHIDAAHPMVSIAAMIAPSPDWCAVATNVSLVENGEFVSERTVELFPWDAGTDSATHYRALDADMKPRGKMAPSTSPYFERDGAPTPVGRVRFVKM